MRAITKLAAACLFAVSLSGCMLPETIDARVELDGYRYRIAMKSRVVAIEALKVSMRGQELTEAMEERLRAEAARAIQEPGYTQFTYVERGRYDTAGELTGDLLRPGAAVGFPYTRDSARKDNFLLVERMTDGTIEVKSIRIPDRTKQYLAKAGLTPSGTIEVTATGTVLDSNATEKPKTPGEPYRWKMTSWDDFVFLKVAAP